MKLIYPSAKAFSKSMEVVWNIIDEGSFKLTKEGLKLMAMDPSQISMIVFELPKELFSTYELEGETATLGLDINYVKNILKNARAGEALALQEEGKKLLLSFFTEKSKRQFKVPLLELTDLINKEPGLEFNNYVVVDAEVLKNVIKDASIAANYVEFVITPDGFQANARSEIGEVNESFDAGSEDVKEVKAETGAKALYPIKYLDDVLKTTKKGMDVKLYMETERPLKMEFVVEGAKIRYYVAPASEES